MYKNTYARLPMYVYKKIPDSRRKYMKMLMRLIQDSGTMSNLSVSLSFLNYLNRIQFKT